MDPATIIALTGVAKLAIEMAANWDNPDYKPPSPEELEALANQIESLPDLPTKEG